MFHRRPAPIVLGLLLLGSLGCATDPPNPGRLLAQRNGELEQLSRQTGMPDPWPGHLRKDPHARRVIRAALGNGDEQR